MAKQTSERKPVLEEVTTDEVRAKLGDLINRAHYGDERIVITRYGKPIAAIIGVNDLEALEKKNAA